MDFKVTGTKDGITACQMDIKIEGLRYDIMEQALGQAREGRMHILGKITETIAAPRAEVKAHAPKIITENNSWSLYWCLNWSWWKSNSRITKSNWNNHCYQRS
jgi:polyribonucleotide nucleotidyltransferase